MERQAEFRGDLAIGSGVRGYSVDGEAVYRRSGRGNVNANPVATIGTRLIMANVTHNP